MMPLHLEGGLIVKLKTGEERSLLCSPQDGRVYHVAAGNCFGKTEITPEAQFRAAIEQVTFRSMYDRR